MAAHRYWRLTGFCVLANGPLELSEARLYAGGTLADVGATVTATASPTSGALASLYDGLASAIVSWDYSIWSNPGFAIVWDLGSTGAIELSNLQLGAGSGSSTYPVDLVTMYSDDNLNWTTARLVVAATYPGVLALTDPPVAGVAAGGDPDYAAVSLLVLANGSSGFVDSSATAKAITNVGATISTVQSTFGGSSAYFNGSNQYLTVPSDPSFNFGTGDFTLEAWVNPNTLSGIHMFVCRQEPSTGMAMQLLQLNAVVGLTIRGSGGAGLVGISGGTLQAGVFQHVAATRAGTTVHLFLAGVQIATVESAVDLTAVRPLTIGIGDDTSLFTPFAGYLDNVRITKGLARYTANFTPPVAAFGGASYVFLPVDVALTSRLRQGAPASTALLPSGRLPDSAATGHLREYTFMDAYNGGIGVMFGTVKEKNSPANMPLHRRVLLIDEASRMTIRETWSDAVTGEFEFRGVKQGVKYSTISYDHLHNYRAVIADNQEAT